MAQHHPGRNKPEGPGRRDQHRFEHLAELGDAEVELDLKHRHADDDTGEAEIFDECQTEAFFGCVVADRPLPLVLEEQGRDRRGPGTADHHQVGRPPQRHVLAEDPVPDIVEGKAHQGVKAAAGHQHAADRCVPIAGDTNCERTRLLIRQHDRRAAGDEQKEQPHQDEVMRRVGQRSRITALADVQADVPDETEQRADDRRDEQCDRKRHPRRSLEAAARPIREAVDPGDLPRPVQVTDPQQQRPDDHGHDGHADHLADRGAATLVRRGNQGNLRRTRHMPHLLSLGGEFLTRR